MSCPNPFTLCSGKHTFTPNSRNHRSSKTRYPSNRINIQKPISRITSLLPIEDYDLPSTSLLEPSGSELSESGYVEVEDREWTDTELMDDARSGRRCVNIQDNEEGEKATDEVQKASAITTWEGDNRGSDGGYEGIEEKAEAHPGAEDEEWELVISSEIEERKMKEAPRSEWELVVSLGAEDVEDGWELV